MKNIRYIIILLAFGILFTQCQDYLETSSPSNTDDDFVTSTTSETFKCLSWCYANYRQNALMGTYRWNDPIGSDAETYPEGVSSNHNNAIMNIDAMSADDAAGGFNNLYITLARAKKIADIISVKDEYLENVASSEITEWTQLYGEAITMWAYCYFQLAKHCGDVPYGYENTYVTQYELTSRYDIYDNLIAKLKDVAPLMFKVGEEGITAERMTQTFAYALIGEIALYSGGYQTRRTDVDGLYGTLSFTDISNTENDCVYGRRNDYMDYYKTAQTYFRLARTNAGSVALVNSDDRAGVDNPFQRHFQYAHDLEVSPETIFEFGVAQGGGSNAVNSEYPYAFGRPSNGGSSNAYPCKSFGALRIVATVYYGDFMDGDKRRDVSVAVTGSKGDGTERMITFQSNSKCEGGIASNKWDENRMTPPYYTKKRQSGINYPVMRLADLNLMLAEVDAVVGGSDAEALELVNEIRARSFGDNDHAINSSGDELLEDVLQERKLELLGEMTRRWDLIRNGLLSERAVEVRQEVQEMIDGLTNNGYYTFPSTGNTISSYIYTKFVHEDSPLIFDGDESNPAQYPGWRGQYDYSSISTSGINNEYNNIAIKGLFEYIDPDTDGATLVNDEGYSVADWGVGIVTNQAYYLNNLLSGVTSSNQPPRYYWPIPSETISNSGGAISNGYGLPD